MKRMFLPAVLASATLMASHLDDSEIQKRVADVHECDLYSLIRDAQRYYHDRIEQLQKKDELECVKSKMKLATCCYLLKEECEAEKLWKEVIATGRFPEAERNLKELKYRYAIKLYDEAIGLVSEETPKGCSTRKLLGKYYAQQALEPSELCTLDQEKIKELTERFGPKVELNQGEKNLLGIQ